MQEMADIQLLRQYVHRNSEEAFAALVARYLNLVYSAALRKTGNAHAAEEIAQAVFIILARKAARLRSGTVLSGWLYQTARLTAATYQRTEIRRANREQEAYMRSLSDEAESEIWPQIAPLLEDAMGKLSEKERNAIALRFFEGKTFQQIATAVGASENAAKKRVAHALEKLRIFFAKHGVVSTTAIIGEAISANSAQAAPAALAGAITAVAVAKGAAASASTLTLIKGALKIMAWAKAKTAIVAGVGLLLAAATTVTTIAIEKAAAHREDALWRVRNPDPDQVPQMVKILPTKFNNYDCLNVGRRGNNWVGVGVNKLQIVRIAYAWRPGRIFFNDPHPEERFDFISTLPKNSGIALRAELKRKFGLVAHPQTRDMDALLLKVRRPNALGLRPPLAGNSDGSTPGHYFCDNSPLSSDSGWYPGITRFLEGYFGMPVIDETGLTQNFHIDLKWNERRQQDPDHNALKQALLDQLGLELVPSTMPIEMLVVEKAK